MMPLFRMSLSTAVTDAMASALLTAAASLRGTRRATAGARAAPGRPADAPRAPSSPAPRRGRFAPARRPASQTAPGVPAPGGPAAALRDARPRAAVAAERRRVAPAARAPAGPT